MSRSNSMILTSLANTFSYEVLLGKGVTRDLSNLWITFFAMLSWNYSTLACSE